MKKKVGIYPWVEALESEGDKHQLLFKKALEKNDFIVNKIIYKRGFPLKHALQQKTDLLILDWVHSFYTSQKFSSTIVKAILGYLDLVFLNNQSTTIIWNLHNLHRHDGKFKSIEKICFRKLAKKVDFIRVFNASHIDKVTAYLKVDRSKIIVIPQGPYIYETNIDVDLNRRYQIPSNKKILLLFGSIRKGKGIDKFLKSFVQCNSENIYLVLAGKTSEVQLEKEIYETIEGRKNIIFDNRFIPDKEVKAYFMGCDHVVLPYENTLNSGILLLAQSNDARLLANDNFKNYASNNDKIGDLFQISILQKMLDEISIEKESGITALPQINWNEVVLKFEEVLNG